MGLKFCTFRGIDRPPDLAILCFLIFQIVNLFVFSHLLSFTILKFAHFLLFVIVMRTIWSLKTLRDCGHAAPKLARKMNCSTIDLFHYFFFENFTFFWRESDPPKFASILNKIINSISIYFDDKKCLIKFFKNIAYFICYTTILYNNYKRS